MGEVRLNRRVCGSKEFVLTVLRAHSDRTDEYALFDAIGQ